MVYVGDHGYRSRRVFFFSSRRRHTRSDRDWSSDVCSSDLLTVGRSDASPAQSEPPLPPLVPSGKCSSVRFITPSDSEMAFPMGASTFFRRLDRKSVV